MTPGEVVLAARRRYNAVNDTFWSDQELYDVIYAALLEVCEEGFAAERIYSSTTVAGTQGYDFPTNAIAIKRVTWDGQKLTPIDMREDDAITALNQNTTDQGNPRYYWIWNRTIYLRPVPASAATLKLWTYNEQSTITASSTTIEIPTVHHAKLVNPVLSAMAAKDQNYNAAQYYLKLWDNDKMRIKQAMKKQKRADGFTTVKDEGLVVESYIGGT